LRNRVAINARRVLDSAKKQDSIENARLTLRTPLDAAAGPYTFVNTASTQVDATVSNLCVTRLDERPCFARVQCNVTVPLQVTVTDNQGARVTRMSEYRKPIDIVMYVPEPSVFPFEITSVASVNCPTGRVENESTVIVSLCSTIITKVIADTDLLIPAYGYCPTPDAVDYENQMCNKFFDLPLYPCGR
jgi:hypothetical protein